MFLDENEVEELSGKQRRPAQVRALSFMGIEHKLRPDGSIAVLRAHVEKLFGEGVVSKTKRKTEPRFDLVN
ncbi:DUF4224 domain-containing protein [Noviherbaspirillum cavernae]|nr:DUF4224 domain-containing protein [Noviherbaspirillum cavernae]